MEMFVKLGTGRGTSVRESIATGPSAGCTLSRLPGLSGAEDILDQLAAFLGGRGQTFQLAGVFSRSSELLPSTERHRIPGAIDAGEERVSGTTFIGDLPVDIPEDSSIDDIRIRIPTGATYLFVAPPDTLFRDNKDPDGDFGVRITKLPALLQRLSRHRSTTHS